MKNSNRCDKILVWDLQRQGIGITIGIWAKEWICGNGREWDWKKTFLPISKSNVLYCQLVGISFASVGASLYFSTDRLPYISSLLLRDNHRQALLRDNPSVPSSPIVVDDLPLIFVAVGLLLSVVSFLGCCGACADSVCFMAFVCCLSSTTLYFTLNLHCQFIYHLFLHVSTFSVVEKVAVVW